MPHSSPQILPPARANRQTIGLLGGSFNPAHAGHVHITHYALDKLGFDEVWWLVSPQNPLKSPGDLASYRQRLDFARAATAHDRRIVVSELEEQQGFRYSYQTVVYVTKRWPGRRFVWLMGADNLAIFHRWRCWRQILATLPVIVFDRAPYSHSSLRSRAALYMRRFARKDRVIARPTRLPSLDFIHLRRNDTSATGLRKTLGKSAFLRHTKGVV